MILKTLKCVRVLFGAGAFAAVLWVSPSTATTPVGEGWDPQIAPSGLELYVNNTDPTSRTKRTLVTLTDTPAPLPVPPGYASYNGLAVTPNGRYIAYTSISAIDTSPFDTNDRADVYVYDTVTTAVDRVSLGDAGQQGFNGDSELASMSADGRYVVFQSEANNFIPGGDANGTYPDVFVRDRCESNGSAVSDCEPSTELVSVGPTGNQATVYGCELNGFRGAQAISGDGRYVVMECWHGLDTSHACSHAFCFGIFLRDRCISNGVEVAGCTDSTELISLGPGGAYPNRSCHYAGISADGSRVVYESYATDLTSDPDNYSEDVFMYNLNTQTTQRLSTPPPDDSFLLSGSAGPTISDDGLRVAWQLTPHYTDKTITLWADCAAINAECGDGALERGCEECDDHNLVDGDGCDSNCTITACGNNVVTAGEDCDDGYFIDGDGCDSNCTFTGCGNDIRTSGEMCDDDNTNAGDGCSSTCTIEPDQLTPGGAGPADCEHEWLPRPQPPLSRNGLPKPAVVCQDDDPSCDIYDEPGNKLCVFRLAICLNVTDPRLDCTPIDVAGVDVKKPKADNPTDVYADFNRGSIAFNLEQLGGYYTGRCTRPPVNVGEYCIDHFDCDDVGGDGRCSKPLFEFSPPLTATNQCSDYADFVVPLKETSPGVFAKRTARIKLKAFASNDLLTGTPRNIDRDAIKLTCLPASPSGAFLEKTASLVE